MPTLTHNFDGGPLATNLTVANSGQVPGNDPFQIVDAGTAFNQIEYKDATLLARPTAEYVLLVCTTGTTAASSAFLWTTAMGSQTQVWLRMYLYLTATPISVGCAVDAQIFECDNGAAYSTWIKIARSTCAVRLFNGAETLNITTTNTLPINDWARVEARITFSTTVGSADLKLFLDPDSDIPDETVSASGWNMGTSSANSFAFGYPTIVAHRPPLYISGLELNNVGWPGPAPFRAGKGVPGILTNPIAIHAAVS